ncbi:MAG: HNH endonuclease [Actinomycetota bacterium]
MGSRADAPHIDADMADHAAAHRTDDTRQLGRRDRMRRILDRDGATCVWCRRPVDHGLVEATTEHVIPRVKGGPSWLENEVAACRRCNGRRGHRTPAEWADECAGNGWSPDRLRLVATLEALQERIALEGGQRRARPYLASQLRRLRRAAGVDRSVGTGRHRH